MLHPDKKQKARDPLSSSFAGRLEGYVLYKRDEIGCRATMDERSYAPGFDRFCALFFPEKTTLDRELAMAWVSAAEGADAARNRASFMREFARYLILEGEEAYVLPKKVTPIRHGRPAPHLFTESETRALFAAADSLPASARTPVRHLVAPACFRLMLCCGLRPNEARSLSVGDVDWEGGVLLIVDSKDRRDRNVPMTEDVSAMLLGAHLAIEGIFPGRRALFPNASGEGFWSWESMDKALKLCWKRAGIAEFGGPDPTAYDFRHNFATNTIRRWRKAGIDVCGNLRLLQEYMGHAELGSTLYYVHLVAGGLGDPTLFDTWEPTDRMKEAM